MTLRGKVVRAMMLILAWTRREFIQNVLETIMLIIFVWCNPFLLSWEIGAFCLLPFRLLPFAYLLLLGTICLLMQNVTTCNSVKQLKQAVQGIVQKRNK